MKSRIITTLLILIALGVAVMKAGSFTHIPSDDPTDSLYFGAFLQPKNLIIGNLPKPEEAYILLARGENGFIGQGLYTHTMQYGWIIIILCLVLAFALYRLGKRRPD